MSVVTEYLDAKGVGYEVVRHPRAFTGVEEALALGVEADEIVKTLVLDTDRGHVLAVIPGSRRLDMRLVRDAVGDQHSTLATEREIQSDFHGFELGSLPPLGELLDAETYVDPAVRAHDAVVFAAGSQVESVKARTRELFAGESVHFVEIAEG